MIIKKLFFVLLITLSLTGCTLMSASDKPSGEVYPEQEPVGNPDDPDLVETPEPSDPETLEPSVREMIEERSTQVLTLIKDQEFTALSAYIHPEKGLRFSPYTYVSPEKDQHFSNEEIHDDWFKSLTAYKWGSYDGSGEDILLTPAEYYGQFIYSKDFLNAESIGYNETLSKPTSLDNQKEVYPEAIVVEYYFSGFDPEYAGMDWQSLRLVFETYEGEWYLTGIIHNQWTI